MPEHFRFTRMMASSELKRLGSWKRVQDYGLAPVVKAQVVWSNPYV
jgi:hypothetical protein